MSEFDPPIRLSKWMDNIEGQLTQEAEDIIFEYYGVEEVTELTSEQIDEIVAYIDDNEDWAGMIMVGFRNVVNWWESETWESENDDA